MKRTLILLAALLALTIAVFAAVPPAVNARQDAVRVEETRLAGDPSAAAGFVIDLEADCDGYLHWATEITLGEAVAAESHFRFTAQREGRMGRPISYIELTSVLAGGHGVSGNVEAGDFGPLEAMVQDVIDRTAPGETHVETLAAADYFAFCPLTVSACSMGCDVYENLSLGTDGTVFWPDVSAFFRLPVGEDALATVSVARDAQGGVYEAHVDCTGLDVAWISAAAVFLPDGSAYLGVSCWDEENQPVDVPACRGLCHLPIQMHRTERNEPYLRVGTANIRQVWDAGAPITALELSGDGSRLLVRTREDGDAWMTVLDSGSMETLQRVPLGREDGLWGCWVFDDELVTADEERVLRLWHWEDGQYRPRIEAALPAEFGDLYNLSFRYDGARLLAVQSERYSSCSLFAAVCGEEGLLYAARLGSSLDWLTQTLLSQELTLRAAE